jgi:hypothetical protein
MTNLEFREALKNGKQDVIFTDIDGKEYVHTILKAGKKQVNMYNHLRNIEYKWSFTNFPEGFDLKNYRPK